MHSDVIVIGAGMAGASVAYFLSRHARVLVLEREAHAGMHATGRSAAMFIESYGSPQVRALTRASRPFFERPPDGFAAHAILAPRGTLMVGRAAQQADAQRLYAEIASYSRGLRMVSGEEARAIVPVLLPQAAAVGVLEPDAADMDVNELHQGYLRGLRAQGGRVRFDARIESIERRHGAWEIGLANDDTPMRAPLLVNAAGAWVDAIARLAGVAPIGIEPRRRSAFLFAPPVGVETARWPLVMDLDETFYFKPDAGFLLGSPANADPVDPHDVQPEELDVATGIHRIEEATTMRIRRPTRTWAGLRSFVADGDLVGGFAREVDGFFWVAAQGGYGIQTSAAMGEACAHLALGRALPAPLVEAGVSAELLDLRAAMREASA